MILTVAVDSIIIKEIPQQYHHFQNCFTILVVNDSNDVIFLRKKTILDYLEYISSVVWLPVKARTFKQSNIHSKQGLPKYTRSRHQTYAMRYLQFNISRLLSTTFIYQEWVISLRNRLGKCWKRKIVIM